MSAAWTTVVVVGVATVAIKGIGPVLLGGRPLPPRLMGVVGLLAPAVLAALVVTQIFAAEDRLTVDERVLGLAAAVVALILRAPAIVVVVVAAGVTAIARLML